MHACMYYYIFLLSIYTSYSNTHPEGWLGLQGKDTNQTMPLKLVCCTIGLTRFRLEILAKRVLIDRMPCRLGRCADAIIYQHL